MYKIVGSSGDTPTPTPPSLDIDDFTYLDFYVYKGLAFIQSPSQKKMIKVDDNGTARAVAYDPQNVGAGWQLYTPSGMEPTAIPAELVSKTDDSNFAIDVQVEGYAPFRFTIAYQVANPAIPNTPV
jgi:hypothetical protein